MHTTEVTRQIRLLSWSLAAFHTSLLTVGAVTGLYLTGRLGDLLGQLDTVIGLTLFGILWLTTGWCMQRALLRIEWSLPDQRIGVEKLIEIGAQWGGYNGVLFLGALLGVSAVAGVLYGLLHGEFELFVLFPFVLLTMAFGSIVAWIVGALIGVLFAIIDGFLLGISRRIFLTCRKEVDEHKV